MAAVAWIGLGSMGSRMVVRLVEAGHRVTVWNRTRQRAEVLAGRTDVRVAATAAEAAAEAEMVALMVTDAAAVAEVVHGPDGVMTGIVRGSTLVDFSTTGPAAVAALGAELPAGVAVLDAPVLGSTAEAAAGTLKLLVGGFGETVERCRPVLSSLGEVLHVGQPGAGAAAKLVANFALMGSVALLGETLALADASGIDRDTLWRLLDTTPLAAQARRRRDAIETGRFPPRFALRLARKDADLITDAARSGGAELRIAGAVAAWLADAVAGGLGELDYTAVLGHIVSVSPRTGDVG
ncbi:NAD(P)-dependent oxidoreductase [Planosporangium mesophilum]|uniref:2-hydroxy-3-oxopropionate reductase n=1 Tax=Planosporangium mesophilum TaxID=689768 RepID=A0A8J3TCQ8_9ACTN|nr:NAD(P)-dependent oxidoreductase [Planosporangium mesophilum]NJC83888.1 NAD(P)-dependent oxidoreductase [Planosporangium mesophilum]GII22752.1 2-hydroxy-3-oxopropionate reductase [Planosporangium mesophilum]